MDTGDGMTNYDSRFNVGDRTETNRPPSIRHGSFAASRSVSWIAFRGEEVTNANAIQFIVVTTPKSAWNLVAIFLYR